MRLLMLDEHGELSFTENLIDEIPTYAILSHTWGADKDEVTFDDVRRGIGKSKAGYDKIRFCGDQARKDKIQHFWVDTCSIDKTNHVELSEAITSMFRWYRNAVKCYVYLSDVSVGDENESPAKRTWEPEFRNSKWFTRGWTLQELLAPTTVEFFSKERKSLGTKGTLEQQIHEITGIPLAALRGAPLPQFPSTERLRWAEKRTTKRPEDKAYCLLGIFDIFMPLIYGEGHHAFKRLQDEINKGSRSASLAAPNPIYWTVSRPPNTMFTGREDILQELDGSVRDAVNTCIGQTQYRVVITGLGGQGKSEICVQLTHRLRQIFWGVFWIDISTPSVAQTAFLELAHKLDLPAASWKEACLGIANLKQPWLLVLDNADDPTVDYQQYIPSGPLGVVLLTSRNNDCQQYATAKPIALEGLASKSAKQLLLKATRVPQDQYHQLDEDAEKVARLLQSHPLALIQAGAYVSSGHCTLAQYPQVYERQRQRLLAFRPSQAQSRYRDVYATFEASADILKNSDTEVARDALQLLPILAVCGPNRLPLTLFEAGWGGAKNVPAEMEDDAVDDDVTLLTPWHVDRLPSLMEVSNDAWDSYRLMESVHLLKAFALVSTDNTDGYTSVSMHPLVHAWARDRQSEEEQHASWLGMGCLAVLSGDDEAFWRKNQRLLQPHIEALTEWEVRTVFRAGPAILVARVLANCGWLLLSMRSDTKLFILMRKMFDVLELGWIQVERGWMGLYDLATMNLIKHGKVREAIPLVEQRVIIQEQLLAEDHPDRLLSQYTLAAAYRANGQIKEAVALLERAVKIENQLFAEDHPDLLGSQHTLAGAYQENGQVKEAVTLLERVVKIQNQSLAEDHQHRLASQHALAGAYQANGQVKEAIALLETVVLIKEHLLTEHHPDRLASQHALAGAYQFDGQIKEAVALLERVVNIKEQSLAEDHPSRLVSQHELAGAYQANGQVKEAVTLLERVVKIEDQLFAENHPDRLASQHALAKAYQANGQVRKAVALLERVVKLREQSLAEDHPDRLVSQHNMAIYLWELGRHRAALDMMARVVQIRRQALDEGHPARQHSEDCLAHFQSEMSSSDEGTDTPTSAFDPPTSHPHPSTSSAYGREVPTGWALLKRMCTTEKLRERVRRVRRRGGKGDGLPIRLYPGVSSPLSTTAQSRVPRQD